MNKRYDKKGEYNIDFHASDFDKAKKGRGRFQVEFKVIDLTG